MNLGIIVEGDDDAATYPILIRKVRKDIGKIFVVRCGGIDVLMRKFVTWLKVFQDSTEFGISKAIVIRDSDCHPAASLEKELEEILETSGFQPRFPVHFIAVKCKLEAWLLADEEAINHVALLRGRTARIQPVTVALEEYNDTVSLLSKTLSEVRLPADEKVYAQIAEASDLKRIANRCPYFGEFTARVGAC